MRRTIPAGLVDSGFAALATFAVTIYGARAMAVEVFGFFALFWAAFLMATIVPGQLWFQPWEVAAARLESAVRVAFLRRAIRLGLLIAFISALVGAGLSVAMAGSADVYLIRAFGLSLIVAAVVSPIQDFTRRMLHLAGYSSRAAIVSLVQFVTTLAAIFLLESLRVGVVWVPFAALTVANVASTFVGLTMAPARSTGPVENPAFAEIFRSGAWLLLLGVVVPLVGLIVNWIIITIAGAALLGLAEAARIVGRPVLVVTNGLGQALRPRSYEAAGSGDERGARRIRMAFASVTALGGLAYTAAVSFQWPGNIMTGLVPTGFEIDGLVLAICLANVLVGVSFPARYELVALRKEGYVTGVELVGQFLKSLAAGTAGVIGGFVIPLGEALLGVVRLGGYRHALKRAYPKDEVLGLAATDGTPDDSS